VIYVTFKKSRKKPGLLSVRSAIILHITTKGIKWKQ
jgi:hypothetical protein